LSKERQVRKEMARNLFGFWAARGLAISHTELAGKLEMSISGIGYTVERGEAIAKDGGFLRSCWVFELLRMSPCRAWDWAYGQGSGQPEFLP
jgi:hypothetical protein